MATGKGVKLAFTVDKETSVAEIKKALDDVINQVRSQVDAKISFGLDSQQLIKDAEKAVDTAIKEASKKAKQKKLDVLQIDTVNTKFNNVKKQVEAYGSLENKIEGLDEAFSKLTEQKKAFDENPTRDNAQVIDKQITNIKTLTNGYFQLETAKKRVAAVTGDSDEKFLSADKSQSLSLKIDDAVRLAEKFDDAANSATDLGAAVQRLKGMRLADGELYSESQNKTIREAIELTQQYTGVQKNNAKVVADQERSNKNLANTHLQLNNILSQARTYYNSYSDAIKSNSGLDSDWQQLMSKLQSSENWDSVTQARDSLAALKRASYEAGVETQSLIGRLEELFGKHLQTTLATTGIAMLTSALGNVYQNVVKIDTAMTELKKVTNETDAAYSRFLDNASERAAKLGTTLSQVIQATSDFARLGYSVSESESLADAAIMYKNVGDDVDSMEQATKSIISTMQGFGIETSNVSHIVDVFNEVANKYATSSGEIGDGMQRSAAAMKAAGNSLEESVAIFTAGQTVTQDADVMGTALKTLAMRIRSAKSELEAADLDTEGMADSVSKLRAEIKALTGVDLMLDDDTFKSTYQQLKEISEVWDTLTDVSQANVLELLFGKRQANIGAAILENFDIAEGALETALNSAGSAAKENEVFLDSIQGRLNILEATLQNLSTHLLDDGLVKGAVSTLNTAATVLDKIVSTVGALPTLLGGAGIVKFIKDAGRPEVIDLFNMPANAPVVTRNELAA